MLLQRSNEKDANKRQYRPIKKNGKEIHSARLGIGYTVIIRKYNPGLGNRNPDLKRMVEQTKRIDFHNRPLAYNDHITKNIPSYGSTSFDHHNKLNDGTALHDAL
ncbi:unnamed protein product [Rhizophagus irregularis]|nr:unnamed protein product [Rhizophagus irregularis]